MRQTIYQKMMALTLSMITGMVSVPLSWADSYSFDVDTPESVLVEFDVARFDPLSVPVTIQKILKKSAQGAIQQHYSFLDHPKAYLKNNPRQDVKVAASALSTTQGLIKIEQAKTTLSPVPSASKRIAAAAKRAGLKLIPAASVRDNGLKMRLKKRVNSASLHSAEMPSLSTMTRTILPLENIPEPVAMLGVASDVKSASTIQKEASLSNIKSKLDAMSTAYQAKTKTVASEHPAVFSHDVKNALPRSQFFQKVSLKSANNVIRGGVEASMDVLDLAVGKAKVVNLRNQAQRVSLSDPSVASVVMISPTQIQLNGLKSGVANLLIWDETDDERYAMIDLNVHRDVSVLTRQIKMIDASLNVLPMAAEDSVVLAGNAASREQAQLAVVLAKAYFLKSAGAGSAPGASSASKGGTSNSMAPGSAIAPTSPNIINLIQVHGEPSTKAGAVREKLKALDPNINMDVAPGIGGQEKVVLTGSVRSASVVSRAINLASVFYGEPGLKVLTGPGGNALRGVAGSNVFQDAESFSGNVDVNILQGSIVTDATGNVVSMMTVANRPQIRCRVKVLDVSRAALKQLGHNLLYRNQNISGGHFSGSRAPANGATIAALAPDNSGHATVQSGAGQGSFLSSVNPVFGDGVTQFLTISNDLSVALSALSENRKARSLAEPVMVALSGEKASFLAGGEIPIPVAGNNGQITNEFHEFGIRLNLIPTLKDSGKIHLQIAPEVSTVDNANTVTTNFITVPAFATRRFQTTIELKDGQSFVMAGLFNQEETESTSKFPGIGSIPIIGSFFRNKFSDRRNRELVVIIQAEVIPEANVATSGQAPYVGGKASASHVNVSRKNASKILDVVSNR